MNATTNRDAQLGGSPGRRSSLLGMLVVVAACAAAQPDAEPKAAPAEPAPVQTTPAALGVQVAPARGAVQVVVVVIDGVRWQDVFVGVERERALAAGMSEPEVVPGERLMPNLHWLIATRGAALGPSSPIHASGPNFVSLPGYQEILSGARDLACTTNDCGNTKRTTLADQFAARTASELGDAAVFSSWPPLARAAAKDPERVLVSAGRDGTNFPNLLQHDGPTRDAYVRGEKSAPSPGYNGYRPDRFTAALAVRYLRSRQPRFLFLSLGDSDELAHEHDYRGYLGALAFADEVVGEIAVAMMETGSAGRDTLLIVTTDHGRAEGFSEHGADHPESSRAWAVLAGSVVKARGQLVSAEPRYLADLTATARSVAGLPAPSGAMGHVIDDVFVLRNPARVAAMQHDWRAW